RYPEGLSELLPLLRDRLDDADPAVVASAVSVVCELAHTDARSYLPLAPKLYRLLTTSANNWMLIKIVKLFAWLTPIEPRLARKLHAPLAHLVATTSAMSLLYECIHTAVVGGIIDVQQSAVDAAGRDIDFAALCARRLEQFYESRDHNLRYVGLVTLVQLQARRPELVAAHYATVLRCLDDPDTSIRMRAIEAIAAMATRKTLVSTVKRLMSQLVLSDTVALQPDCPAGATDPSAEEDEERKHVLPQSDATGASLVSAQGTIVKRPDTRGVPDAADSPEYRLAAVEAILSMCSRQSYANTSDFEWYVATLIDLVYVAGPIDIAPRLSERLLDVTVRVRQVRAFSVAMARRLLSDPRLLARATSDGTNAPVLATAAYILGEYCALQPSSADDIWLLLPRRLAKLADEQQAVFVQASMKVYVNWLRDVAAYWSPEVWEHVRAVTASTQRTLSERFLGTAFGTSLRSAAAGLPLQVASRLRMFAEAVNAVSLATSNMGDSAPHVCAELHVLFGAYELNPVSNAAQAKVPVPDDLDLDTFIADPIPDTTQSDMPPPSPPPAPRRRRTLSRSKDPFILPSVDDIPMLALQLDDDANHPPTRPHKTRKSKKKSRRKHNKPRSPSPPPATVDIAVDEDMPESAK
ncbi:AP-3 complex subunit delta, partial [Coemansia erecta]